tara:strand:- start:113 stop:547 length:435 start_codon:yes stop_codon:yes gene_type:complete
MAKTYEYLHEFFQDVCDIEDRDERIAFVKENAFKQAKSIMQLCYNDKLELDLPQGKPPYRPCPQGRTPSSIKNAFSSIGLTVKGNNVKRIKKEKVFIGILESIHEEDAAILIAAKDGNITTFQKKKYSKITKSLVEAALPELLK